MRRRLVAIALLAASLGLAGCATPVLPRAAQAAPGAQWSGRLSLNVASEPAQSFTAAFELQGSEEAGELLLSTPLGSALARMSWAPGRATLVSPQGSREFASVDALLAEVTGTAVPVRGLFAWLAGREAAIEGWQADLSRYAEGRLSARRTAPAPVADLRLVLDKP